MNGTTEAGQQVASYVEAASFPDWARVANEAARLALAGRAVIAMVSNREQSSVLGFLAKVEGVEEIRRTHGRESVRFAGGGWIRFAASANGLRGMTADAVLILMGGPHDLGPVHRSAHAVVAPGGGSIVGVL